MGVETPVKIPVKVLRSGPLTQLKLKATGTLLNDALSDFCKDPGSLLACCPFYILVSAHSLNLFLNIQHIFIDHETSLTFMSQFTVPFIRKNTKYMNICYDIQNVPFYEQNPPRKIKGIYIHEEHQGFLLYKLTCKY